MRAVHVPPARYDCARALRDREDPKTREEVFGWHEKVRAKQEVWDKFLEEEVRDTYPDLESLQPVKDVNKIFEEMHEFLEAIVSGKKKEAAKKEKAHAAQVAQTDKELALAHAAELAKKEEALQKAVWVQEELNKQVQRQKAQLQRQEAEVRITGLLCRERACICTCRNDVIGS